MDYYAFTVSNPFLYYKSGEFYSDSEWKHKYMYRQGDYEIIICIKGPLYIQVGTENYTLQENDVLLVPPYMKIQGYRLSTEPVDFYWLHFFADKEPVLLSEEMLMGELSPLTTESYTPVLNDQVILPMIFCLKDAKKIFILFNQILDVANSYHYSQQENDYLITAFLIELSNHFLLQLASNHAYYSNKIDKVKEWIRANITEDLTVEQVAQAMQLNPDYLTRLFKRYDNRTTMQFINDLKIETAQNLLVRTNLPINQIATRSHFADEKNFMHRFKKKTGLTPTEYRNAYIHTHLNNPRIDPIVPLPKQLEGKIDIEEPWIDY